MPKTVALLGNADSTLQFAEGTKAREVWVIGGSYHKFPLERITRIYELHPRWMLADPAYNPGHLEWLENEKPEHIRVVGYDDYPLQGALAFCGNVRRGDGPNPYFTSSIDFLIAAALLEGFGRIELYGLDMGTSTEHKYQLPGASFWLGLAAGRGVEVWMPENCSLLRGRVYAFEEGAQMISRQKAEYELVDYTNQKNKALARVQNLQGIAQERRRMLDTATSPLSRQTRMNALQEVMGQLETATAELYLADGAAQAMERLIAQYDMAEPEDLRWRFAR